MELTIIPTVRNVERMLLVDIIIRFVPDVAVKGNVNYMAFL